MSVPPAPPLLLASTSPQRRAILEQLRIPFELAVPDYEEHDRPTRTPSPSSASTPPGKRARSASPTSDPSSGSTRRSTSTGACSASPGGPEEAEEMLEALGGHDARGRLGTLPPHAGLGGRRARGHPRDLFRALTPRDLAAYMAAREWEGRAGGYAIQGLGAALVERDRRGLPERRRASCCAPRPPPLRTVCRRLRLRIAAALQLHWCAR